MCRLCGHNFVIYSTEFANIFMCIIVKWSKLYKNIKKAIIIVIKDNNNIILMVPTITPD